MNERPYRPYCLLHKTPDSDVTKRQRSAALRIFHPPKNDFRFPTKIRLTKVMCLLFKHLCYMSNTSHVVQSKLCKKCTSNNSNNNKNEQQQKKKIKKKQQPTNKTTTHTHTHTYTTPLPPRPSSPRKLKHKHKHKERQKQIKNLQHINLEAEKQKPDARPIMICSLFGNQTV